jgi:hypothetical protein
MAPIMSVEREQFRLDMYERTPKEYIQTLANVLATGQFGFHLPSILSATDNPAFLGSFMMALHKESKDIVSWLLTEDGGLVDTDRLDQLFIAFDYAFANKLVTLPRDRMPKEVRDFIENKGKP